MSEQKREQRPFDPVQKHLSGLLMNTILAIVEEMGEPYPPKPGLGGLKGHPPRAMTVVYLMLNAESRTCRRMVGYPENNPPIIKKPGAGKDAIRGHDVAHGCTHPGVIFARAESQNHTRDNGRFHGGGRHGMPGQPVCQVVWHTPRRVQMQARMGRAPW